MSNSEKSTTSLFDKQWNNLYQPDDEEPLLKRISVCALIAMGGGILSLLIFVNSVFLFFPILSIVFMGIAAWTIGRSGGTITGAKFLGIAAWFLLFVAVGFPINQMVYKHNLIREADSFMRFWFQLAQNKELVRFKQYNSPLTSHAPVTHEDAYWKSMTEKEMGHEMVHRYLSNPFLLTITTLKDKAKLSFYRTVDITELDSSEHVFQIYAVTYPREDGTNESFFFEADLFRVGVGKDRGQIAWGCDLESIHVLEVDSEGNPISQWEQRKQK